MKVYKDLFTQDEMFSDSYPCCPPFDDNSFSDVAIEVRTSLVKKNTDCGVPDNSEEGEGGLADAEQSVIDVVDTFNLTEMPFGDKKVFAAYLKGYMKKVLEKLQSAKPDRVAPFKEGSQLIAKKLMGMYDDLVFYAGSSMDNEAAVGFGYYKDGEISPRIIFLLDGLKEEKF